MSASLAAPGAVKITPAHDPNDFLVGKRHSLEFINILDDNGNINDNGGSFKGQPRFTVRQPCVSVRQEVLGLISSSLPQSVFVPEHAAMTMQMQLHLQLRCLAP